MTDKNPSKPEPLQSLQKVVILGQVKVIARQRRETLMTVVCQVFGLALSRELQLNPYLLFYKNERSKRYYRTRANKEKVHKTHFATFLLTKKLIIRNCWLTIWSQCEKEHSSLAGETSKYY